VDSVPALVPPFGESTELAPVPGFGEGLAMATPSFAGDVQSASASGGSSGSSSSSNSSSTSSSSGGPEDAQYRRYAASMMKQYDKNGDGVLDKSEWSQSSTISSHPERFDKKGDGKITMDELVDGLKNWNHSDNSSASSPRPDNAGSSSSSGSGRSATSGGTATDASVGGSQTSRGNRRWDGGGNRGSSSASTGKHYLNPKERLPEGLPDWFLQGDKDGDGQVSMHEFASPLTEEKIAEFNKYDLNGDGFITPDEVLKVSPPKK
jgi:Ca2+-binding EF-hand superfamily protein